MISWKTGLIALSAAHVALFIQGCGAHAQTVDARASSSTVGTATCRAFDELSDVDAAIHTPATFGASSDLFYLVDTDDELGYVRVARARLEKVGATGEVATKIALLEDALVTHRAALEASLGTLARTYRASETALDRAATCANVDMRDLDQTKKKESRAKLASKACEPAVRLFSAVKDVDLTSDIGSSAVAAHTTEMTLDESRTKIRDDVAHALKDHAAALRLYRATAAPSAANVDAEGEALVHARTEMERALEETNRACALSPEQDRVVGGTIEPRRATVTVRPKWTGPLATLPHAEEFGSGFIVRFRVADGHVETRVVTNNHVMDGAFDAEIVASDGHTTGEEAATFTATLVQSNPHDDVAILRVEPKAESAFHEGLAFRLSPAREEEPVIAAGFPGIGVRPSFQVSRGSVSNATFGAESGVMSALVQHTAPIDRGNSGGPLLDKDGRLIGMNTFKISGRENVGLAIPTARIERALIRAEHTNAFDPMHAEGDCNAVVAALASPRPAFEAMSRFGLPVYAWSEEKHAATDAVVFRDPVARETVSPIDVARTRAYATLRSQIEKEHGIRPFEICGNITKSAENGSFSASFATRSGKHTLTFAEEHGALRAVAFE